MDTANASLSAMDKKLGENVVKTNMLEDKMSKLQLTCDVQAKKIEHLQERVERTESRWLENNLMFCGFAERGKNENCEDLIIQVLHKLGIKADSRTFQYVYRLGRYTTSRSRPIIARFQHMKDRNETWTKRKQLPNDAQYIRPMYPPTTYRKRRVLQTVHSFTDSVSRFKGKTRLLYSHKLQVETDSYQLGDLHMLPEDLQKAVGTTSQGNITAFFGMNCPFSNFYPSPFVVNDRRFSCNEQFYYYSKACHAKYYNAQVEIMAHDDPAQIKRIGKRIGDGDSGSSQSNEASNAMHTGLLAKFEQNPYLRRVLLSTGENILVEANPHDTIWGIGLDAKNPKVFVKNDWQGKNQLGDLLMTVRWDLMTR
jgi:ribA/ribD-fused uncharacterized protein